MADPTTANPPATPAAFDPATFASELAKQVSAGVADVIKPFSDRLAKLESPAAPASVTAAKPLTMDDVQNAVKTALTANNTQSAKAAARNKYAADKMKDVPAAYTRDLPETDDANALAAAEQNIRKQWRDDLTAAGVKTPPVTGAPPAPGSSPAAALDFSKQSAQALIEMGVKQTPVTAPAASVAAAAAAK